MIHHWLFHPKQLLSGKEDAANNYGRDHHMVGKDMVGLCWTTPTKCIGERGLFIFSSFGGEQHKFNLKLKTSIR